RLLTGRVRRASARVCHGAIVSAADAAIAPRRSGVKPMRKTSLLAAVVVAFAFTAPTTAFAIDDWIKGNRLNVPADQWLSPSAVADKLAQQGYKVLEIEADDGAYEVEMLDKNGVKVETHVHPATAELLPGYDD